MRFELRHEAQLSRDTEKIKKRSHLAAGFHLQNGHMRSVGGNG
jgi:hypothetical protein